MNVEELEKIGARAKRPTMCPVVDSLSQNMKLHHLGLKLHHLRAKLPHLYQLKL